MSILNILIVGVLLSIVNLASGNYTNYSYSNESSVDSKYINYKFILVTTAVQSEEIAKKFAREMVQRGIAALVNIFQPVVSVYRWDGQVQEVQEILLHIYTQVSQFDKVEQYIRENSLEAEPGILSIPIVGGSTSFLNWMGSQAQLPMGNMQIVKS